MKAIPCPECKGLGKITIYEGGFLEPGSITKIRSDNCFLCEGYKCVWIEPIKPREAFLEE